MKFVIDNQMYSGALDKCRKALGKNDKDDNYFKLIYHEATQDGLKLITTDLNKQIEYFIPCGQFLTVIEEGVCSPYGDKLVSLVKGYPDAPINVCSDFNNANGVETERFNLSAEKTKRKLSHWIPCGDKTKFRFDSFKLSENNNFSVKFPTQTFEYILKQTEYAISKNMEDKEFTNICIDVSDGSVKAIGSDKLRVSYIIKKDAVVTGNGRMLIFGPFAKEIISLIDGINPIDITSDGRITILKQSQLTFYFRQMATGYIDWEENITSCQYSIKACVSKDDLLSALKNINIINDNGCTLRFKKETQELEMLIKTDESVVSGGVEVIPCISVDNDVSFFTDPKFLLESISHSKKDIIEFDMIDSNNPFRLKLDDDFYNLITVLEE